MPEERIMNATRIMSLPLLFLALGACSDALPTGSEQGPHVPGPALAMSDAVHQDGVPQFFWLPPTVPNPGPLVTGTFDGGLLGASGVYPQLEVRMCPPGVTTLCPMSGAGSFKSFNGYGADPITLQQAGNYQLLWNKNPLVSGNTYRAWVLVHTDADGGLVSLGFADVRVVATSQALKQVDANAFVGLVAGNPLYLKFTVRTGIAGAISVALGSSTLAPHGSTTATATVRDLYGAPLPNVVVGWTVAPDASTGSVTPTSSTTDAAGKATTTLTAGGSAGSGSVTATVGSAPGQLTGSANFAIGGGDVVVVGDGLSAGAAYTCGLTTDGVPYCWGLNDRGQLGNNSTASSSAPVAVVLPAGVTGFAHVSAGLGEPLFGGGQATCALTGAGVAYCWGANDHGQLGNGTTDERHAPVMVALPAGVSGFTDLSVGGEHACALTGSGAAYCWGNNASGQLGNASTTDSPVPVAVTLPAGVSGFVKVTAGGSHSCALAATGAAYCWGEDGQGQIGNGPAGSSATPVAVTLPGGVSGFEELTAGGLHTCGLTAAGAGYCWGDDSIFQLGNGPAGSSDAPTAIVLPAGVTGFTTLAAGGFHTCGVANTGTTYCWGVVVDGEDLWPITQPAGVSSFARLTAGIDHTCALTSTGAGYCWGFNSTGQLGNGSTNDSPAWLPVSGGLTFRAP
jgi:alpha-tubulin suppressor-like RCC1 family protein